eukprot:TRINITY_DN98_c0_g3_i1.p2 TRINITY_DN98_c0_g3~~TRINITY_DN98_c0_g3_i1.p2  ORF type:complete len:499 (+),score=162.82 TRINITY_DN98_c0_g3_i1:108-1604(+)
MNVTISGLGKSESLHCTATEPLATILGRFCTKYKLPISKYALKHRSKKVDLSLPLRLLGITSGARLEIVRNEASDAPCRVGLQLVEGGRKIIQSSPQDSLLSILHKSEFTTPPGMAPAMTYMSHDLQGEVVLERTTLESIGVAGGSSVLLRVRFVPLSEVPPSALDDAAGAESEGKGEIEVEIEGKEGENVVRRTSSSAGETSINPAFLKDDTRKKEDGMMEMEGRAPTRQTGTRERESETSSGPSVEKTAGKEDKEMDKFKEDECIGPLDRRTKVYTPSETRVDWDIPDDVYELTSEDIRLIQEQAVKRRKNEEKLMTREMRQRQMLQKKRKYRKGYIRVRMPSGYVLEGQFRPKETMEDVRNFVQNSLSSPTEDFSLYIPPTKITDSDLKKTLESMDLLPACMVHLAFIQSETQCDLSAELIESALPFDHAEAVPGEALVEPRPVSGKKKEEELEIASPAPLTPPQNEHEVHFTPPSPPPPQSSSKSVPKWFQKGH